MKKLLVATLATIISFSSLSAKADMMDYLKDYGLPCAAGFLGGMLAKNQQDGVAIGLGVCFGVGASTYLQSKREVQKMRDEDFKAFQKMMEANNQLMIDKTESSIATMEEKQKKEIEATRQIMKEVIAERLASISEEVKGDVRRHVEKTEFMVDLERKVMMKIKEEVKAETTASRKEIVEQVVEDVMKQVVLKKVGVPGTAE